MDLEHQIKAEIQSAVAELFAYTLPAADSTILPTRKEFEGDYTFVTFPLVKVSKKSPEETGKLIGEQLIGKSDIINSYNVVKGFLNLSVKDSVWLTIFNDTYRDKNFGQLPAKNKKVIIEYSSPNTNKPLHLGHMRNIFLGYSVAQIQRAAGYDVEKVNLINDRGIHICKSMLAYRKFGNGETPESSGTKGDHLIGNYYVLFDREYKKEIQDLMEKGVPKEVAEKEAPMLRQAQEMLVAWEQNDAEVVGLWKRMNQWVYNGFEVTYRRMGVDFDKMYYESDTYLLGKAIVEDGLQKGVFYQKPDSSVWADLRNDGLDEKLLLRSDGTSVYITQDLGTADLKYTDYKYDKSVYVVGNEQDYHFEVLFKLLKKLGRPYADGLFHLSYGMVDLPSGRMKSREGTVVDADDMMDEMASTAKQYTSDLGKIDDFDGSQAEVLYETLAMGALKYFLLKVDPKKRMMFNPEESIQFHGNTGPFIQYTYARISAVKRKAEEMGIRYDDFDIQRLESYHPTMKPVIFLLNNYHKLLDEAAEQYSPSVISQFVYDLAKEYNRFYTEETILKETDENYMKFKVAYSVMVARMIKKCMNLLGINVPERM